MSNVQLILSIFLIFVVIVNGVKVKERFDYVQIRKTVVRMAISGQFVDESNPLGNSYEDMNILGLK